MTDEADHSRPGLFVSDAEIYRRWGIGEKTGRRVLLELRKTKPGRPRFPQPDPLFGGKTFWPAVMQWCCDYYGVRRADDAVSIQPSWEENFDVPPRKTKATREPENARPQLART